MYFKSFYDLVDFYFWIQFFYFFQTIIKSSDSFLIHQILHKSVFRTTLYIHTFICINFLLLPTLNNAMLHRSHLIEEILRLLWIYVDHTEDHHRIFYPKTLSLNLYYSIVVIKKYKVVYIDQKSRRSRVLSHLVQLY